MDRAVEALERSFWSDARKFVQHTGSSEHRPGYSQRFVGGAPAAPRPPQQQQQQQQGQGGADDGDAVPAGELRGSMPEQQWKRLYLAPPGTLKGSRSGAGASSASSSFSSSSSAAAAAAAASSSPARTAPPPRPPLRPSPPRSLPPRSGGGGGAAAAKKGKKAAAAAAEQRRRVAQLVTREDLQRYPPFLSAMRKLGHVAATYDPLKSGPGLTAFDGAAMDAVALREQVQRSFGLALGRAELGAVVRFFDKDGDGKVDCGEFLNEFFKVGRAVKHEALAKRRAADEARARRERQQQRRCADRFNKRGAVLLRPYTEADLQLALHRLGRVAATYDRARAGLAGFAQASLTPHEFKLQLAATFRIRLPPAALSALVQFIDKDGDGEIDCGEVSGQGLAHRYRQSRARPQPRPPSPTRPPTHHPLPSLHHSPRRAPPLHCGCCCCCCCCCCSSSPRSSKWGSSRGRETSRSARRAKTRRAGEPRGSSAPRSAGCPGAERRRGRQCCGRSSAATCSDRARHPRKDRDATACRRDRRGPASTVVVVAAAAAVMAAVAAVEGQQGQRMRHG